MPSNIAMIVGNGLDLTLGLKTSYKDFYNYVSNKKPDSNNKIYKEISSNPETWTDFESRLGQYTYYFKDLPENKIKKELKVFYEEIEEIREDLGDYLELEEKSIDNLTPRLRFIDTIDSFFDELITGHKRVVERGLGQLPRIFSFVTLNYTNTLEKIVLEESTLRRFGNAIAFAGVHHIHGDLSENLTFGVSDEKQLYSGLPKNVKQDLTKPQQITSMGDERIQTMRQIINGCELLVIFGTSLGDTDMYIWAYIISWLQKVTSRRLIVHKYDPSYSRFIRRSPFKNQEYANEVKNKLLGYSDLDNENKEQLKSRIFVIHNTQNLFYLTEE